jgi:hypothetical protein
MMRRSRAYLIGSLMAGLAITALGAPAAALETGSVAIVNGMPGGRVDICLGSQEIRSGLRYGGKVFRSPAAGTRVLKVYRADPRKCKGTLLAKKGFTLAAGGDLTLVATVKAPKVVIFDNAGLGTLVPSGANVTSPWAWRHAADIGKVNFRYQSSFVGSGYHRIQPEPYVSYIWRKGDQEISPGPSVADTLRLRATRPGKKAAITTSKAVTLVDGRRNEWYLLGTTVKNAKFVVLNRAVS